MQGSRFKITSQLLELDCYWWRMRSLPSWQQRRVRPPPPTLTANKNASKHSQGHRRILLPGLLSIPQIETASKETLARPQRIIPKFSTRVVSTSIRNHVPKVIRTHVPKVLASFPKKRQKSVETVVRGTSPKKTLSSAQTG